MQTNPKVKVDVLKELDQAGALFLNRHFVFISGRHSSSYLNLDLLFPNISLIRQICSQLVAPFLGEFDAVAAPAVGGIVLAVISALVANERGFSVAAVWADKQGKDFVFERAGFANQLNGKRLLVVEDFLVTGGSAVRVCQQAKALGASVIGISGICNRGGVTAEQLGVPRLETMATIDLTSVPPEECELCCNQVPIVEDIGHGAHYREKHPDYPGGYIKIAS